MMENKFERLYLILGSSLIIQLALVLVFLLPQYCSVAAVITPLFLTVVSLLALRVLKNPKFTAIAKFNNAFMLVNAMKMLFHFAFVIISYLLLDKPFRISFVVVFLALYLIFLVVDTYVLLRIFKNKDSQPK